MVSLKFNGGHWSLITAYGPVDQHLKDEFLDELRDAHADCPGPAVLCGDFNMIYQAADKSNDRLNLRSMRRFCRAIDDMQIDELYLHGRLFTWSNERRRPTMERIDRVFAIVSWIQVFPNHHLRFLSSDCSDHARLLLQLTPSHGPNGDSDLRHFGCANMVLRRWCGRLGVAASKM
jgi:hypothetical protein